VVLCFCSDRDSGWAETAKVRQHAQMMLRQDMDLALINPDYYEQNPLPAGKDSGGIKKRNAG
jgi:hypothetical protein